MWVSRVAIYPLAHDVPQVRPLLAGGARGLGPPRDGVPRRGAELRGAAPHGLRAAPEEHRDAHLRPAKSDGSRSGQAEARDLKKQNFGLSQATA